MKQKINSNVFNILMIIIILLSLTSIFFNININIISSILVTLIMVYGLVKSRNNLLLFFSLLVIDYFVFSVILCRYLWIGGPLNGVFYQLKFENTSLIGLNCLLIFYCIISIMINQFKPLKLDKNFFTHNNSNKKTYTLTIFIILVIIFAFLNNLFFHIVSNSEQIYEYCLMLFIFGFYYAGNNKKLRTILSILLISFSGYTLAIGGRVPILQMLIAFFIMNMIYKYNYKKIIFFTFLGIIAFTIFGIYGDHLDWNTEFSFKFILDEVLSRRLSLDTSISAYFTGLTFVDYTNYITIQERLSNLVDYIKYTFLGSYANYKSIPDITISHYVHYYGGYITSYFYYWLGIPGVVLISSYIGYLFKKIVNLKNTSSSFLKLYCVYIIATIPRWFLYFPTALFRGTLIFIILYICINIFISGGKYEKS